METSTHAFGHQHDVIRISRTIHQHLFIFSFTSQREREAMKDKRTCYGTMDKSKSEQQMGDSVSIFCIVIKTGPILPPLWVLQQAGRQAGRQNKGGFQIFKILYNSGFCFFTITAVLLQYQNCISVDFCQVKLILRCVLKCEKSTLVTIFSCQSLLLGTNVPDDNVSKEHSCAVWAKGCKDDSYSYSSMYKYKLSLMMSLTIYMDIKFL